MSQIFKSSTTSPPPPTVLVSLRADDNDTSVSSIIQPTPTNVTASANVIILNGDNGIETAAIPNVASNAVQVRFSRGSVTTSDGAGQTQTVLEFTTLNNTTLTLQILVAGYSTDNLGVGGYTTASVVNVAGVATLIDVPDIIVQTQAGLAAATFTVDTSGANLRIRVTGVAGKTINWSCCTPGIISQPI